MPLTFTVVVPLTFYFYFTFLIVTSTEVIVPVKYRRDFEDIQNRFAQLFDEVAEIFRE